ncbi:shikimate kinase [Desulfitispora alkaliphila]|uniref:shikimate kinase n=1 Tax=Desulfitispora alkaliphila TaxID=622674 RepID=UPI003D1A7337
MGYENIVLVGFMGVGKTTVGRKLAKRLKKVFVDTDGEIEQLVDMSTTQIFKTYGEKRFRSEETLMLRKLSRVRNSVISTGGGIVLNDVNREIIRKIGTVIWLKASASSCIARVGGGKGRPLLRSKNINNSVISLMEKREELYRDLAHITVQTDNVNVDFVVETIIKKIEAINHE